MEAVMPELSLAAVLQANGNDFTDRDLAVLADWADQKKRATQDHGWQSAYALIRQGSDSLLRRRARDSAHTDQGEPL